MKPSKYSILIIPDNEDRNRQFSITRRQMLSLIMGLILILCIVVFFIVYALPKLMQYKAMEAENERFSAERVKIMELMQLDKADDFVMATGETHTIREFADVAFKELDMDLEWQGDGVNEKGIELKTGKTLVAINPRYFRPTEVDLLIGDATKAQKAFGWKPKVKFDELAKLMAKADWKKVQKRGF